MNYIHKNGGWKGPPPTWDTRAPVDDNGKYDVSVRSAAQADMNEFTRMIEALTLNGVQALEDGEDDQDVDHNIDRPWNEIE